MGCPKLNTFYSLWDPRRPQFILWSSCSTSYHSHLQNKALFQWICIKVQIIGNLRTLNLIIFSQMYFPITMVWIKVMFYHLSFIVPLSQRLPITCPEGLRFP